ncbi:helix-turn-helix domain-containing protein [Streptomyces galbus]|uniref:Helix-turn-helix domain-containing protein n=1 Tax=Streptomyces galbus TaxID=33898 RepID=A0ABX1IPM0_STRGB|nr:helix-turn-helix domain-containing protein [Streptomyces galbus]
MRLPQEGRPGAANGQAKVPDPLHVHGQKEFREALKELRGERSYQVVASASRGGLSATTIHNVLTKDALPKRNFVAKYLPACGLGEADQERWLACWERLNGQPAQPGGPGGPGGPGRWQGLLGGRRRRLRVGVAAGVVLALTAALVAWQVHESNVERFREQHCGTSSPDLVTGPGGECTGVTDGSDGAAVFGDDLKPVMKAIGAENTTVTDGGDYVTFAFLTPLSSTDANSLTVGQYVAELEGAYTAVEEENKKDSRPKIRLLVASMGSSERAWKTAVDQLKSVKDGEHLVAVAGLGLSQQETVDATRELAKADLPMIGDLITADGFDATGAVDGKGPINGLARVALSNTDQLTAISKQLGTGRRTAALVSTQVTPNGTRDLYTESLRKGFRTIAGLKKHLDPNSDFAFDPRGGPGAILPTISQNFCNTGKTIDTVYYAARVKYLPGFLDALAQRSCHAQPITVITGSDAASLDPKVKALHTADAPITVLYSSFPSPEQLRSPANPDRGLYEAFVKNFTAPHHDQQFPARHLTSSYWAIVAHDAVLTASTALHNAAAHGAGPTHLPNRYAVRNELYALRNDAAAGASGPFGIAAHGTRPRTDPIATVHRLGQALPKPTG